MVESLYCIASTRIEDNLILFLHNHGLLTDVVAMLGGPYGAASLRGTCRIARELVPKIWYRKFGCADGLLMYAAREGNAPLCRYAKEQLGATGCLGFNWMLATAAFFGHEHLCRLAKEWGADWVEDMLTNAARGGHEHLCILAKEWGAKDFGAVAMCAKDERIMRLAQQWIEEEKIKVVPV
jgi:hypothetical protein